MGSLRVKEIVNILLTGILISFLMFLMVEVLFAHFINSLLIGVLEEGIILMPVSYTHLRAHET